MTPQQRPRPYIPPPTPEPVWIVDRVGDVFALVVISLLVPLVGIATTWEVWG
jgi:hypothetical protein